MEIGRSQNADEKKKDKGKLSYMKYLISGPDRGKHSYKDSKGSRAIAKAKEKEKIRMMLDNMDKLAEIAGVEPIGETEQGRKIFSPELRIKVEEIIKEGSNDYINQKLEDWKTELFKDVPRYFTLSYNEEKDLVEAIICSEAENIRTLFGQTSIEFEKRDIENRVKKMVELGLISDTPIIVEISEEDCLKFFTPTQTRKNRGPSYLTLRDKIDKQIKLSEAEKGGEQL